jgi:uncharacterized protein
MTKVIAAIKALGIADADIATSTVSLGPVYDYAGNSQRIRAWQLQNAVSVTVRDLDKVSDVIDDGINAGATTLNGVGFDVSDRTGVEAKARENAMKDAKAKADALASAAGISITGVASISEQVVTPIWYGGMRAAAGASQDSATPVQPGSTDVTITVTVAYLIP